MAKKAASGKSSRNDPAQNKSLAIRTVLDSSKGAKVADVVNEVKKQFGHDVTKNMVYMVKTKKNMASNRKRSRSTSPKTGTPMTSAALWVDAIKTARHLLKATGSVENATALLKAIES